MAQLVPSPAIQGKSRSRLILMLDTMEISWMSDLSEMLRVDAYDNRYRRHCALGLPIMIHE